MVRSEYLEWAKERAYEFLDRGEDGLAVASFVSDLNDHDELREHDGLTMLMPMMMLGEDMRKFIGGFN